METGTATIHEKPRQAERERVQAQQDAHIEVILGHRATTLNERRSKARSLAGWNLKLMKARSGDLGRCLSAALVRDLIA